MLHERLEGSATLMIEDTERQILLLTVADRGRGRINITGTFPTCGWGRPVDPILEMADAFVLVAFEGLQIDQSYLPKVIHTLKEWTKAEFIDTKADE